MDTVNGMSNKKESVVILLLRKNVYVKFALLTSSTSEVNWSINLHDRSPKIKDSCGLDLFITSGVFLMKNTPGENNNVVSLLLIGY